VATFLNYVSMCILWCLLPELMCHVITLLDLASGIVSLATMDPHEHTHMRKGYSFSLSLSTNATSKSPIIEALRGVGQETCGTFIKPSFYQGQLEACLHPQYIQSLFLQKAFLALTGTNPNKRPV